MDDNMTTIISELESTTLPPEEVTLNLELYYYKLSSDLFVAIDPIITFVGLFGSVLIMMIMQGKTFRSSSFSVYMTALAIADALVLIFDFINNWFKMELDIYLLGMSNGFCKFHRFFFNVCYTMSAWCVVAATLEKLVVVWFPLQAKVVCNRRTAIIVVSVIPVPCIALYLYNLWAWGVNAEGNCDQTDVLVDFQTNIAPWISGTAYSYLPIVMLVAANSAIVYKLKLAKQQRISMGGLDKSSADDKAERRITLTVVLICFFYIILTTPLALFYFILFTANEFINPGPQLALAEVLVLIFGLSNHAINVFILFGSSMKFRAELKALMPFQKKQGRASGGKEACGIRGTSSGQSASAEGTASTAVAISMEGSVAS